MPAVRKIQDKMNQLIDDFMKESPTAQELRRDKEAPADAGETDEEVIVTMDLPALTRASRINVTEDTFEEVSRRKRRKEEKEEEFTEREDLARWRKGAS